MKQSQVQHGMDPLINMQKSVFCHSRIIMNCMASCTLLYSCICLVSKTQAKLKAPPCALWYAVMTSNRLLLYCLGYPGTCGLSGSWRRNSSSFLLKSSRPQFVRLRMSWGIMLKSLGPKELMLLCRTVVKNCRVLVICGMRHNRPLRGLV